MDWDFMVVSMNAGPDIDPVYYNPYNRDSCKGTLNFKKPPHPYPGRVSQAAGIMRDRITLRAVFNDMQANI